MPGHTQEGDRAPRDKSILYAIRFGVVLLSIVLLLLSTMLIVLIIFITNEEGRSSQHKNGAIYTRWGRSVCPEDATLLYEGLMVTGLRDATGGPANYICLTKSPQYANNTTINGSTDVYLVKYSILANDVCSKENAPGISDLSHHIAVCAVCRSSRVGQLMIPGQMTCLPNWRREYFGYLMSSRANKQAQRSTVCVDHAPDVADKETQRTDHNFLYPLQKRCSSSTQCYKYKDAAELTCVLCTQ